MAGIAPATYLSSAELLHTLVDSEVLVDSPDARCSAPNGRNYLSEKVTTE
jgi:hypothetical protein